MYAHRYGARGASVRGAAGGARAEGGPIRGARDRAIRARSRLPAGVTVASRETSSWHHQRTDTDRF